jgi:8-hydroxy-5-deazaflavin:NADPH oxidoreductase
MRVGILGSGLMGGTLGTLFARAGHDVVFSYARSEQKLKRLAREAHVVSAFGMVPSEVLFDVFESKRKARRPSLLYCGDHQDAKTVAATLIRDVGFDPVDAGPLRIARYMEPFTLLIAQLAYEGKGGPELAYRFERFGK